MPTSSSLRKVTTRRQMAGDNIDIVAVVEEDEEGTEAPDWQMRRWVSDSSLRMNDGVVQCLCTILTSIASSPLKLAESLLG